MLALFLLFSGSIVFPGIAVSGASSSGKETITITDQLGRTVIIPRPVERIVAFHHLASKIVFALGSRNKLVGQALFREEGAAMAKMDPAFAKRPQFVQGHAINHEAIVALKPDVAIVYASFNKSDVKQLEQSGIRVVAIKGETFTESYESVRLVGRILDRSELAEAYIADCEKLLSTVKKRIDLIPVEKRPKVMFSGPRNMSFSAATGEMLQSTILERAGARNVATGLKGFWAPVSGEQIAAWNPDVIFLGSGLDSPKTKDLSEFPQLQGVKAVRERRVYHFPSNIGWWDYPAPHCALGVVWAAKTLYPDRFRDLDIKKIADEFYAKYMGFSFTAMGGKL